MIQTLQKQIEEEKPKLLAAFQALVRRAHAHYKKAFEELMASTNGQILYKLHVFPYIVMHTSQTIADHDVNSCVVAGPSAIQGLLTTSHRTVIMGLQDLYNQGEIMPSGDAMSKLGFSKTADAADDRLRKKYHNLATKVALIEARLISLQNKRSAPRQGAQQKHLAVRCSFSHKAQSHH